MQLPRTLFQLLLLVTVLSCSKDDGTPADPNDDGAGNQTVTVISMAKKDAWTYQTTLPGWPYTSWENGVFKCSVAIDGTPPSCRSLDRSCTARSANRIDFTQYKTCRVQFHAYARADAFAGNATAKVTVVVLSNVPATPDLEVVETWAASSNSQADELDQTFDLSIENALGFHEGTVIVHLQTFLNEPQHSICQSESFIEIHGFKVVGTK